MAYQDAEKGKRVSKTATFKLFMEEGISDLEENIEFPHPAPIEHLPKKQNFDCSVYAENSFQAVGPRKRAPRDECTVAPWGGAHAATRRVRARPYAVHPSTVNLPRNYFPCSMELVFPRLKRWLLQACRPQTCEIRRLWSTTNVPEMPSSRSVELRLSKSR